MGRTFDAIDDALGVWIARQPMFFVATAPLAGDAHVNVSPKGPGSTLRVLGPVEAAYLDYTGSGAETIAHVRENGRIVLMWCAFEGAPQIVRLHGRGELVWPDDPRFDGLVAGFQKPLPDASLRCVVRVDVQRVSRSCGYTVPLLRYEGEREHMPKWTDKQLRTHGETALDDYRAAKNAVSIDGLPAVG
jgi:Pyridoxamine 5'-phosphate oxidase